jgi:hypothetical protein
MIPPITTKSIIDEFTRVAPSNIHGLGLFATTTIEEGTPLGEYEGIEVTLGSARSLKHVI